MTFDGVDRTLYLHAGTGKAGTTSIQYELGQLQDAALDVLPVKAFGFPNATRLAAACGGDAARAYFVNQYNRMTADQFVRNANDIWDRAKTEVSKTDTRAFVASSEFLCALVRGQDIDRLKLNLDAMFNRVEVILYLRDQTEFLRSLWAQQVKGPSRSTETLARFMSDLERRRLYWDYAALLKDWVRVFGQDSVSATVFNPAALHGGDVVHDFFHKIGLGHVPIHPDQEKMKNVSPSMDELEKIRLENLKRKNPEFADADTGADAEAPMSPDAYKAIVLQHVSDGNRWINEAVLRGQSAVTLPVLKE